MAPGVTDTDEAVEAAEAAEAAKLAREQQEQADAANSHPNTTAAEGADEDGGHEPPAESVNEVIQEAGAEAQADTSHGELERPARTASTEAWVAYAAADTEETGLDLTPRAGLRDEIAEHYLGAKA